MGRSIKAGTEIVLSRFEQLYERTGAYIMGRNMFDEGEINWPDPPPFRAPVFVLTSRPRQVWYRPGGATFTFVTKGLEDALGHARTVAGEKDVHFVGGANIVQQALNAGHLSQLQVHLSQLLLGDGARLFE